MTDRRQSEKPDSTGAENGHRPPGQVPGQAHAVHGRGQRLDKRGLVVSEPGGDFVQPPGRHREDVRHPAFPVAAAEELQVFTKVLGAVPTRLTVAAHQGRLDRDPVTDRYLLHAIGDANHCADHLVPWVVGGLHEGVLTVDAGLVGPAHSRHGHPAQRFAGIERRHALGHHLDDVGGTYQDTSTAVFIAHGISNVGPALFAGFLGRPGRHASAYTLSTSPTAASTSSWGVGSSSPLVTRE